MQTLSLIPLCKASPFENAKLQPPGAPAQPNLGRRLLASLTGAASPPPMGLQPMGGERESRAARSPRRPLAGRSGPQASGLFFGAFKDGGVIVVVSVGGGHSGKAARPRAAGEPAPEEALRPRRWRAEDKGAPRRSGGGGAPGMAQVGAGPEGSGRAPRRGSISGGPSRGLAAPAAPPPRPLDGGDGRDGEGGPRGPGPARCGGSRREMLSARAPLPPPLLLVWPAGGGP